MAMFDPHNGKLRQVREVVYFSPLQQDILKFLALMLMVLDHANRALGLNEPMLLLLGRGAFPLFALIWGYNLAKKPVVQAQANRLWLWSFLAQPGYALVMQHDGLAFTDPNILFLFAVVTQALALMHQPVRKGYPSMGMAGALLLVLWNAHVATPGTYGQEGILLLLASYGLCVSLPAYVTHDWPVRGLSIVAWPLLTCALNARLGYPMMLAGLLLPTLLISGSLLLSLSRPAINGRRLLSRGFFLRAYVAHLLVLGGAGIFLY